MGVSLACSCVKASNGLFTTGILLKKLITYPCLLRLNPAMSSNRAGSSPHAGAMALRWAVVSVFAPSLIVNEVSTAREQV